MSTPAAPPPGAVEREILLGDRRWTGSRVLDDLPPDASVWSVGTVAGLALLAIGLRVSGAAGPAGVAAVGVPAGVLALVQVLRVTLARRGVGRLVLLLDPFPGTLGGHVGGVVEVPLPYLEPHHCLVTLSCRAIRRGVGMAERESVHWSHDTVPVIEPSASGVRVRFTFEVPLDLPASAAPSAHFHTWDVRLRARTRDGELDRGFEVPVLRLAEPLQAAVPAHEPARDRPPASGATPSRRASV